MFEIIRYTDNQRQAWDEFVSQSKNGTFLFLRGYMDYHRERFADHSLMAFIDGRLAALLPANREGDELQSHGGLTYGGFITDRRMTAERMLALFEETNDYLRRNGFRSVRYKCVPHIYHVVPAEEDLYALFRTCRATLLSREISSAISLSSPVKWRRDRHYKANKAARSGVIVEQSDRLADFYSVLGENLFSTHGVHPVHSLAELELLKSRFPDNIRLYTARRNDVILGGVVLYLTPRVVHSQYISANEEGKRLHALDAVFRRVLCEEHFSQAFFDFGKSTESAGTVLNEGLIRQKEGFGARAVCYDTYGWELS